MVRQAAVRAAIGLIAERGYAATSMAQVAAAADISPSGLAHHFPSKAALLGAVLDHRDAIDAFPVTDGKGDPWDVFDGLPRLARTNMRRRQLVALYNNVIGEAAAPGHPAHEWMLRHYADGVANLAEAIRSGQSRGLIRQDAPGEAIAREAMALMDGLQVQWLLDPSVDMAAAMQEYVEQLKQRWGASGP